MHRHRAIIPLLLVSAMTSSTLRAQTKPADRLDFGTAGLDIPPAAQVISITPRGVTLIGETMLRATGTRRLRLARDLSECRSPLALPYLRKVLTDPDPLMRAQAAQSAARVGDGLVVAAIHPLLRDPVALVRREAVLACAALGDDEAVTAAIQDTEAAVVSAAIQTSRRGDAIARRLNDFPPALRTQAIRRLGELGAREHAATIARFLAADTAARVAAVEALATLGATEHAEAVRSLLRDQHPAVRRAATAALMLAGESERGEHAMRMLADAEAEVRQAAAEMLARHPRVESIDGLAQQLDDGDEPLRLAAREALVALKDDAIQRAAALLTDADPRRREDGSYILGHLRSGASIAAHVALLKDNDWTVVRQAAWSLGRIGPAEARDLLAEIVRGIPVTAGALPHEQQAAYAQAVIAAARLDVRSAVEPMARLITELAPTPQRSPAPELRAACVWGFGVRGSTSDAKTCDALLGIVEEILEQGAPKVEAVKALGHLRYAPAAGQLKRMAEESFDAEIRWMACWSYERITGAPIAYAPPVHTVAPDVSIVDLPR